jgi:multidrug resistance protein, MATE family
MSARASTRSEPRALDRPSRRRELTALLALAIPVVLSELGWMSMNIVDTIMVGRLSPEAIGAVGLSGAMYYAPALFGIGLLLGLDTLVSQAFGRGDLDDCHRSLAQGVYIASFFSPILMALIACAPAFLSRWGVNHAVEVQADAYLRILNWSTLPLLLYASLRRYLQGMGKVRPVTFALISANLVNWGGNWALIYGKLGMPAMGVRGSALSTCVARIYMAGVLLFAAWRYERRRGHRLFAHWPGPDLSRIIQLLRLGLPTACQITLEVGAFGMATVLAGKLTASALAAHQIVLNCASLTYMVPLGISAAAAVAVGQATGAAEPARARRVGWMAVGIGASFMALAGALMLLLPKQILHVYTHDPAVVRFGIPLLALAAAFQIFDGIQTVATGALRGLGETRTPMILNLVGYWVFGLPLGAALCFRFNLGIYGIWIGLTLALIIIAMLVLEQWRRDSKAQG